MHTQIIYSGEYDAEHSGKGVYQLNACQNRVALYAAGVCTLILCVPLVLATPAASPPGHSPTKIPPGQERERRIRMLMPAYASDRLLVKFYPGTPASHSASAHRSAGGKRLKDIDRIGVQLIEIPQGQVQTYMSRYRANPHVEYAEPDYYRLMVLPDEGNDPGPDAGGVIMGREYFEEQWGLNNTGQLHTSIDALGAAAQVTGSIDADIDAPEGWDISTGHHTIRIGILDTGIDCHSIEHTGKCVEEISFVGGYSEDSDNPDDYIGHGTHVAGIAATHTDNGIGVAGVGWNSSLGNLKTCFAYQIDLFPPLGIYSTVGVCPVSASAAAITYAADNGYHVINMSYGSDELDAEGNPIGAPIQPNTETAAINYAWSQGVVMVAAAGNDGDTSRMYPAANDDVIAVGATNRYDDRASFSTFSTPSDHWVTLLAPGKDILSTTPIGNCVFLAELLGYPFNPLAEGCMTWQSGTSMASPHVAGAAALVWAHLFPGRSPAGCVSSSGVACNEVVRRHLQFGADITGANTQNFQAWAEHGRLNLYGALSVADLDMDGLPDNVDDDADNDGLSNTTEALPSVGTDPLDPDSDDDGLSDGQEVNYSSPPADTYSPGVDTNPLSADTDGDGYPDGMEVGAGHDPLLAGDHPLWGDADGNGQLESGDVLLVSRALLGLVALTDLERARADIAPVVSGVPAPDLQLTLGDLLVIEQLLLGTTSYP